jgi:2-(1,2-epoxy-1,2-dihydrophenyl)acetyl-CoA isomerase
MPYETMLFDVAEGVATLSLNRPEKRNALNHQMAAEILDALKQVERDAAVRVLVVTGAGPAFCAGQDLDAIRALREQSGPVSFREHLLKTYNAIVLKMRGLEKPVIAAVNGVAAGAGWGLALACDFRYAADNARFRLAFGAIGLAPDTGTSFFLAHTAGLGRALELAYTNEIIGAQDALAMGLVNKVFPAADLLPATLTVARQIAQGAPRAMGLAKRAMYRALHTSLEEALDYEAYLQDIAGRSDDYLEGVAAVLEKRQPVYKGK